MKITVRSIESISPFVRFAGRIDFNEGDVTKARCNADHRIFYVKKGSVTFFVGDQVFNLKTDDAILITSGSPYKMKFSESTALIIINFVFIATGDEPLPPRSLPMYKPNKFRAELSVEDLCFENGFLSEKVLVLNKIFEISQLLEKTIIEFKRMEPFYLKIISEYLTACLLIIYRRFISGETGVSGRHTDILDYISKNFVSPLTNKDIAEVFHYHPNYVNQIIKGKTGMSLHQYLLRLRLLNAVDLLLHTEIPINEIAHLSGFSDAGYFSLYFKKNYGCSPNVFKGKKSR